MKRNWFNAPQSGSVRGIDIVRIAVAIILSVHGFHGVAHPNDVVGFGGYLSSIGLPFGVALAWLIMIIQILCSVALIVGRLGVPACIGHMVVLGAGIGLIHASNGWFVVGPGHDGVEYSITLVACLFAVLWAYWPRG